MVETLPTYLFGMQEVILFVLAIPLLGAVLAAVVRAPNLRDISTLIVAVALFINVVNVFFMAARGQALEVELLELVPGITLSFLIDPVGMLFALVASFLWFVTTLYSIGYMRGNKEKHQNRFYAFFALAIFAALGIALAGNLFTLFVFYEVLTLVTYPLVTHAGSDEARRAGRTYLGILLSTSIALQLIAIIWTWQIAGTLDFVPGGVLAGKVGPWVTGALLFLYVYGVGKAALMPIHRWLPAAMVAPTPVSALLHAVAVVKAGVFTIVKVVVYIFGTEHLEAMITQQWWAGGWLVYIAGITIVWASVIALQKDGLKARLAYSTISQLAYIVMAVALFAPKAIMAAVFHIAAHAFGKITLFFAAGAIYTASGKKAVSELDGIGKQMPWTMTAFAIGALSMIGVPPAVGFLTKYYLVLGALETAHWFAIAVVVISTLLNAAYFLPIVFAAFFGKEQGKPRHGEAPLVMVIAMIITATLTLGFFVHPDMLLWLGALAAG